MTQEELQSNLWEMVMDAQRSKGEYMQECGDLLEDVYYWFSEQLAKKHMQDKK